jgi:hypothetical protein
MGGRKTLFIMNFGRLARDKNIKCIFFGTYETVVKINKFCFFIIMIVTNIKVQSFKVLFQKYPGGQKPMRTTFYTVYMFWL